MGGAQRALDVVEVVGGVDLAVVLVCSAGGADAGDELVDGAWRPSRAGLVGWSRPLSIRPEPGAAVGRAAILGVRRVDRRPLD